VIFFVQFMIIVKTDLTNKINNFTINTLLAIVKINSILINLNRYLLLF